MVEGNSIATTCCRMTGHGQRAVSIWSGATDPAQMRPYYSTCQPNKWRTMCNFGTGSPYALSCVLGAQAEVSCQYRGMHLDLLSSILEEDEPKNESLPRAGGRA